MVWVNPNEPFPDEPTRHALSDRSHVHVVHHDREEERDEEEEARARGRAPLTSAELDRFRMIMEQERQQMVEEVATNNGPLGMRSEPQPDIGRTQDLEMVATHASVEGLRLPPDLIALAYDRNDGDIVNAIMNLTEPIFRRQLERELAERQAEAAEEEVVEEEEAEDDFEEDLQARQRELDLWLLGEPGARVHARARRARLRARPGGRHARTAIGAHGDAPRRSRNDGGVSHGAAAGKLARRSVRLLLRGGGRRRRRHCQLAARSAASAQPARLEPTVQAAAAHSHRVHAGLAVPRAVRPAGSAGGGGACASADRGTVS